MRPVLFLVAVALVSAAVAFGLASRDLPDIELRTTDLRTGVGGTSAESGPGEVFVCAHDGLRRIDVAVSPPGDHPVAELELELRGEGPTGPVLQRVHAVRRLPSAHGDWLEWVVFELEPLPDSAGRRLHVSLVPAGWFVSAWARTRGLPASGGGWGDGTAGGGVHEGEVLSEQADLRALAFAAESLSGPATLTLTDPESGREVRRAVRRFEDPVQAGWVLFSFEPILDGGPEGGSRWKRYRYRLEVDPASVLRTTAGALDPITFHGSGRVDERLLGMTRGAELADDRDLVFRAWSSSGPGAAWELLVARAGWRLPVAFLAFLAACAALGAALSRNRSASA